ncbi:MAG: CDP-glycerol glycerophosphotransferase family protein [Clostridium sp.]|nr:CDP-glycerol glycerophosphotransferase family protein [Clostridium sp.]
MRKKLIHLWDKLRFLWYFLNYFAAAIVSPLFRNRPKYQHLWLISERGTDAQDNGIHFYRYLRREHPEINAYYLLSAHSPDRRFFSSEDKLIRYRSFSHYLALVLAEYKISSHIMGFTPDMWFFTQLDHIWKMSGKLVFLQHGIIKDDMSWCHADNARLDLFVCGAKPEAEAVAAGFGHPPGVVRYLGLCRYDNLPVNKAHVKSGIVLFMPTWRAPLKDVSLQKLKKSTYYRGIIELLNNEELGILLERQGCKMLFAPHSEVLPYLDSFYSNIPQVQFLNPKERDVQRLLIETDVLITDYSSVFFDFAYQRKPIIYYQCDNEEYRSGQYSQGYFKYETDGFGPVVSEVPELLKQLEEILYFPCMEERYAARLEKYFIYHDKENCKRNYEAIAALGQEKKRAQGE